MVGDLVEGELLLGRDVADVDLARRAATTGRSLCERLRRAPNRNSETREDGDETAQQRWQQQ